MEQQPSASSIDLSRPVATHDDSDEYISLKEALGIFIDEGRPVTERSLQRYCGRNHLICKKVITGEGEKWFTLRSSVRNRLRELEEFDRLRAQGTDATGRDLSRQVGMENAGGSAPDTERQAPTVSVSSPVESSEPSRATTSDTSSGVATGRDKSGHETPGVGHTNEQERALYDRLLAIYASQIEELRTDKEILHADKRALLEQLVTKDKQIERFFASDRDTKTLFGSLQSLMSAIWPSVAKGQGERYAPVRDALESGLDQTEQSPRA